MHSWAKTWATRGALAVIAAITIVMGGRLTAQTEGVEVHIVGASVSGGFRDGPAFGAERTGDTITLHRLLRRWADGEARISTHNTVEMTLLFTKPMAIGKRQVALAERKQPDIVLAVDFPFWFAYGYIGQGDELSIRRRMLAAGLALLEGIEAPILLGDLPDMAGAASRMLGKGQIPAPATLQALNEDLVKWALARPNVHLVELGAVVQRMRGGDFELALANGKVPVPQFALLQEDRLHPTRLGMALLGHTIQPKLRALFSEDHPLRQREWTLDEFIEGAGADGELDVLLERAAAAGGAGKSGKSGK